MAPKRCINVIYQISESHCRPGNAFRARMCVHVRLSAGEVSSDVFVLYVQEQAVGQRSAKLSAKSGIQRERDGGID